MKKTKTSNEEIELQLNPINIYTIQVNGNDKEFNHNEFMEHLQKVYQINTKTLKAKRSMLMHMDGDFWFSYLWQWELESGLKFTQFHKRVREENDPMRFM